MVGGICFVGIEFVEVDDAVVVEDEGEDEEEEKGNGHEAKEFC